MKKIVSVLVVILVVGAAFTGYTVYKKNSNSSISARPLSANEAEGSTIVSAQAAAITESETEAHSADGQLNAVLEEKQSGESSASYSLYSCDVNCTDKTLLFQQTLPKGEKLELPVNAWSPDNKYVFVAKKGSGGNIFLVFRASGETFSDETPFIDVSSIFAEKQPNLILKDVTGWDSETLLHVFTNSENGDNGPSFWFEVPGGALIQLGSH